MEPHRARSTWLWNYAYRGQSPQRQNSAIPIPSGNTIVAVPDGQLGRRLIGVEYLRQGWGRNCTDTARAAGLSRTNRHAARGRVRTGRDQSAPGDPGRMNV